MKKFLSLVLALVMTMSLVTISAGAAEYKDLTDKNEIKYAEAVAVLNKIGIITGYEDNTFKATANLSRGAAAKIIVSLMIGSEAANALTVSTAPYKDVAASSTFAPYISYCKTAKYISGYADGSFRPGDPLTGYAFSKMLLGALGYDGTKEGFTGSGWTMNVASVGSIAGIYSDITGFSGNAVVTREVACQMALNTLKATAIRYTGQTVNVTGAGIDVSVDGTERTWVENGGSSDGNMPSYTGAVGVTDGRMQFGEEHFTALKLTTTGATADDFGRPANSWTYKSVTIGNFAIAADFSYTKSMVSSTDTATVKASKMGLKGYVVAVGGIAPTFNGNPGTTVTTVAQIADLTKDGRLVELYISPTAADTITDVVVIDTAVAQVTRVASEEVTLKTISDGSVLNSKTIKVDEDSIGYTQALEMKKDADVLVVPVTIDNGASYSAYNVWAPISVTGALTAVGLNATATASNAVTVAGTKYGVAYNADISLTTLDNTSLTALTKKDVQVYVDQYGYAIYGKEVTAASKFMIVTRIFSSVSSDGTATRSVTGLGTDGEAVTLNVGDQAALSNGSTYGAALAVGSVYKYDPASTTMSNTYSADYQMSVPANNGDITLDATDEGIFLKPAPTATPAYTANISTGDTGMLIFTAGAPVPYASDVKFVYYDVSDGTTSVKEGVQKVSITGTTTATGVLGTKNGQTRVVAVFVSGTPEDLVGANVLYINKFKSTGSDTNGKTTFIYEAYMDGVATEIESKTNVGVGNIKKVATYSKDANELYTLSLKADNDGAGKTSNFFMNKAVIAVNPVTNQIKVTDVNGGNWLWANSVNVIDVDGNNAIPSSSLDDLADQIALGNQPVVSVMYNDNNTTAGYKSISNIFVEGYNMGAFARTLTVNAASDAVQFSLSNAPFTPLADGVYTVTVGQTIYVRGDNALQKITGLSGIVAAPEAAPTVVGDKPVYAVTVSTNLVGTAATATTNWYTVTIARNAAPLITNTTEAWTIGGVAAADGIHVVEVGVDVVCTATTAGAGFTAVAATTKMAGGALATAAIATAYVGGAAPSAVNTTPGEISGFAAATYTAGAASFTWTVAAAALTPIVTYTA